MSIPVTDQPYWQHTVSRSFQEPVWTHSVDTLIVGGGYTGLSAAIECATKSTSVWVVDQGPLAEQAAIGCSSRNGGQVGFSLKPSFERLSRWYGEAIATAMLQESMQALVELEQLLAGVDVDWQKNGTFVGATTLKNSDQLKKDADAFSQRFNQPVQVIEKADLNSEIESPLYIGGVVYPNEASIHPRKLHLHLLGSAAEAGVHLASYTEVTRVLRLGTRFKVTLKHMPSAQTRIVYAERVLIATNGKTTAALDPVHRWVFPVGSYQLATQEIDAPLAARLFPKKRNVSDTRRVITYTRLSPDGRRVLFGGRSSALDTDVTAALPLLRSQMLSVFPQLEPVGIDYVWLGSVGFTFREHPLVGEQKGLYFSLGYCGQGIPLACYYGKRMGQVMAGTGEPPALWNQGVVTRPYYWGQPWFLPLVIKSYQWADRLGV
jgi:glycine/D-amino acid oxidase-like deaminating enzyme